MSDLTKPGSTERQRALTSEILERVRELAQLRLESEPPFVAGETPVRYAGRVYDAAEMVNLVDSALEFWLTAGRYAKRLEADLAAFYGLRSASLVNSGSSANLLAFSALTSPEWKERRIRPGDEVITVAAGFPTTVAPILQYGAVPVFVDVSLPTYNVDVSRLEDARSPRTKAVFLAHTLGNPFDLEAVTAFCKKHGLWLVEDNCDANGSLYQGRKTGTFGDLCTLSFYPPHHMTTGEGGAVLARDARMATVVESIRDWGRDCWCPSGKDNTCGKRFSWRLGDLPSGYDHKYTYSHLGYNLKLTDLQAAVGVAQLQKLEGFGRARRENWAFFREALAGLEEFFVLPEPTRGADPSWFGFLLTVREGAPFTREEVVRELEDRKIQTRMLFAGNLVRQPAITALAADAREVGAPAPFRVAGPLTQTDAIMSRSFWWGVYPGIGAAAREYIAETLTRFVRSR
ncbi:lipopolysaccharide biosynthesis protein RfbH [Anaeromyxobacter paludicola]|uniref:Lipopolysaccharide biosynthesis protein RfbH n=1 Tax=Anaeromyxobacter paludicola TaxID=2918171 RepID=A0ABM7X5T4_9BACT|nr:lipopolysaccharide biosynthesis protein RfbH [Anaeromyxobacter paludicola]BDG07172.1 lipopolysaccharide biosynthesis protein RfbH [Anaeromyxobacter paludicola]